jgi:L-alanine-DL-glutamate epimerase-like enolase superfamily enzyme
MDPIDRITVHHLAYPEPNDRDRIRRIILAQVETKAGVVGWGEAITGSEACSEAVRVIIERGLAPILQGRDPSEPRARWQDMRTAVWWYGRGGIANFAISALDMAIWDLAGKLAGLPVHRLLGGKLTDRVPAAASIIWDPGDLDWTRAEVTAAVEAGFRTIKCGWGRTHEASFGLEPKRDLAAVAAVRETIGDEIGFATDVAAIANWTRAHAVRMARAFEPFQLAWFEDALDHLDIEGYRRIRTATTAPLATGERVWTHEGYRRLVESGAVDIVLIDPGRAEGLTGMVMATEHAAAVGVRFVPHSWSSAVNTAAALHVFASRPNGHVFELKLRPSPMQFELVADPFTQRDGWIEVPDRPGLGCEIDAAALAHYTAG